MLKILWKRGKIAPEEQFLPLSTILYNLMLDFYVKTGIRFSLRDKRLFEITEVEITRVDCISIPVDGASTARMAIMELLLQVRNRSTSAGFCKNLSFLRVHYASSTLQIRSCYASHDSTMESRFYHA